jgi:acyl-CoA synthetase (AMP-forming)/AMP-acid ligase II
MSNDDAIGGVPIGLSLSELLDEMQRSRPTSEALICGDCRVTYGDLARRTSRLADGMWSRGVRRADRVVWLGHNCHRIIELLISCGRIGAALCPINWRQSEDEMTFVLDDLAPAMVLYDRAHGAAAEALGQRARFVSVWIAADGPEGYESLLGLTADRAESAHFPDDANLVVFTAAFGGAPSGAMLSQANLLLQGLIDTVIYSYGPATAYLASSPMFHIASWMGIIPTLQWGGRVIVASKSDPETIAQLISDERCTAGFLVQSTCDQIAALPGLERFDLQSFTSSYRDGAWGRLTSPDTSPWGKHPGGYGQTEVTGGASFTALTDDGETGVRPIPGMAIRIVDDSDADVPEGQTGEIILRGPTVGLGYWNRPELNASRQRSGWWYTNDLGRRTESGTVVFVGPKGRLIKTGMENVYPAEVEACLRTHPDVADAAVIGVPDERWDQSVKAIVVLKPAAHQSSGALIEHCKTRMASYKKPRVVEFVEGPLPRIGPALDYARIDAEFGGGGYPGS